MNLKTTSLSKEKILSYLSQKSPNFPLQEILIYDEIDSTNEEAKRIISKAPTLSNALIIAKMQTAGKGRLNRDFFSPKNTGLYMSIVLDTAPFMENILLVTPIAAVATANAISTTTHKEVDIKWVNDLYLNGKKVCGILTEGIINSDTGMIDKIVIGIGINVYTPENEFPNDLKNKAGALDANCNINELVGEIFHNLMAIINNIDDKHFIKEYKRRSIVIGKNITIANTNKKARVLDINDEGNLEIIYLDGSRETLISGEVSIIPCG